MTAKEFFKAIEEHYGQYERNGQRQNVAQYLSGMGEKYLDKLMSCTIQTYSARERINPPDIADFEKLSPRVCEDLRLEAPKQIEDMTAGNTAEAMAELHAVIERLEKRHNIRRGAA